MRWEQLLDPDVQAFIKKHDKDDVRALALRKLPNDAWHAPTLLDQIKVRQRAQTKVPILNTMEGFIFPPSDTFEQASSGACAAYKSSISEGTSFIDLTAGSGIDSLYLRKKFSRGSLIEKNENAAAILKHNFRNDENISIHCCDALEFLESSDKSDLIYIDPQRRKSGRKGIYDLQSCSPDIIGLLPKLAQKAKLAIIKTSPILDIEKAIKDLIHVQHVHVVQWNGECKEVLYILNFKKKTYPDDVTVTAVEIDDNGIPQKIFLYIMGEEKNHECEYDLPQKYIYEPGRAFFKAGGYNMMSKAFGLKKLHKHTHLFTSNDVIHNFPGKHYKIIETRPVKSKKILIKQADITLRNFPGTVDMLHKKLGISGGGAHRIFAVTLCDESKKLIICKKQQKV